MMKNLKMFMLIVACGFMFTGCYERIPAGYKGKIMGNSGFQTEVYPPSKIWLSTFLPSNNEKLYLMETTTRKYSAPIVVVLKDKLELRCEINFRCRISGDDKNINAIFNDIPMNDTTVSTDEVYKTYGSMVVLNTARQIISQYGVDDVNTNYQRMTAELYEAIKPKMKGLPLEISDVTIGKIKYPDMVTKAIEAAKQRRMDIEKMEAQVQIDLAEAKGKEEVAKATYRIKMLEAKQIRDYNVMIAEGVTSDLLKLRDLEVKEKTIEAIKGNANVIYMPFDMMSNTNHMRTLK